MTTAIHTHTLPPPGGCPVRHATLLTAANRSSGSSEIQSSAHLTVKSDAVSYMQVQVGTSHTQTQTQHTQAPPRRRLQQQQ